MKEIPLTQGKVALVDDEDYEWLSQYKWCAHDKGCTFYAERSVAGPPRKMLKMHQSILKPPADLITDHINGNGLDNRRCNLRAVTIRENSQNRHHKKSSKYPGVTLHRGLWYARITIDKKLIHLGCSKVEEEAYYKYKMACEHPESIERKTYSSIYTGVSWNTKKQKWISHIQIKGNRTFLGYYTNEADAALAYDNFKIANGG